MSFPSARVTRLTLAAGLALLVSACGDGGAAVDESANQSLDSNILFDEPANDASALESVDNAPEPVPASEPSNMTENETQVTGNSSGGDTGGNTVEGEDVVGM